MKRGTIAWRTRILSSAAAAQVGLMVSCGGPTASGGFGGDDDGGSNTDSGGYSASSTGSGSGSPTGGSGSGGGNASSGGSGSTSSGSGSGGASTGSSSGSGSSAGGGSGGTGSSGGSGSTSSGSGGGSGSSSGASGGPSPTKLPTVSGTCPTFQTGNVTVTAGASSIQAQIWMGSAHQGGMLILYWHGTGSSANSEVPMAFDTNAVTSGGGMIVGFNANTRTGTPTATTGNNVWYQSDAAFADQVVACAIQQLGTDARRIHTSGYSAGGLQTVYMWFARSGYIASVISYSGGDATINKVAMQDATNLPGAIASHGAMGSDVVIVDFANTSATWESEIKMAGGFSIDCNDGGNHTDFFTKRAPGIKPAAVKFFLDHPFKVKPEPYAVLPSEFPSYCKIN